VYSNSKTQRTGEFRVRSYAYFLRLYGRKRTARLVGQPGIPRRSVENAADSQACYAKCGRMTGHRQLVRRIKGPSTREGGQITCLECDAKDNLLRKNFNHIFQSITETRPVESFGFTREPIANEAARPQNPTIRPSARMGPMERWRGLCMKADLTPARPGISTGPAAPRAGAAV
jgi:hypothetical protein